MEVPLISVIVPVFNLEEYLPICMRCLMKQTYKNLEIILVDDGSSDKTWELCQGYAKKYAHVFAYHKKNGGAASARNFGVKASNGEWITFIDADDWVTRDYIEYLYHMVYENKVDMAICGYQTFYNIQELRNICVQAEETEIIESEEALKDMLYRRRISASPCIKLMRKETFDRHPFPEGKLYEDLAVVYLWFDSIEKLAYNPTKKYFYLQRPGSSMNSKFNARKWDLIEISEEIFKFIERKYPSLVGAARSRFLVSNFQLMRDIPMSQSYKTKRKYLIKNIKSVRKMVLIDDEANWSTRVLALGAFGNIYIMKFVGALANSASMYFRTKAKRRK